MTWITPVLGIVVLLFICIGIPMFLAMVDDRDELQRQCRQLETQHEELSAEFRYVRGLLREANKRDKWWFAPPTVDWYNKVDAYFRGQS